MRKLFKEKAARLMMIMPLLLAPAAQAFNSYGYAVGGGAALAGAREAQRDRREAERIRAEIRRIEAETRRIELENERLDRQIKQLQGVSR